MFPSGVATSIYFHSTARKSKPKKKPTELHFDQLCFQERDGSSTVYVDDTPFVLLYPVVFAAEGL